MDLIYAFEKAQIFYIQKDRGPYIRFLVGVDVGVVWSNAVEETGEPNLDGRPLPCHITLPGLQR